MPLIQSMLIKYDSDMGFEKDLAVSYQLDESGPVWTFTLRGEAVTASDVAFTFVFLMAFAVMLGWFPIGMRDSEVTIWKRLHHLVLPAFTLSLMSFSNIARHTRQKMIEVMDSEYVLFARARGEGRRTLLWRAQDGPACGNAAVCLFCGAFRRFCAGGVCLLLSGTWLGGSSGRTWLRRG